MKAMFKAFVNWFVFIITGKGEIAEEAAKEKLVDFSGQGHDIGC
jgi:hypothetical protein